MDKILQLLIDRIDTPLGELLIAADQDGNLRATSWSDYELYLRPSLELHYGRNGFTIQPVAPASRANCNPSEILATLPSLSDVLSAR